MSGSGLRCLVQLWSARAARPSTDGAASISRGGASTSVAEFLVNLLRNMDGPVASRLARAPTMRWPRDWRSRAGVDAKARESRPRSVRATANSTGRVVTLTPTAPGWFMPRRDRRGREEVHWLGTPKIRAAE